MRAVLLTTLLLAIAAGCHSARSPEPARVWDAEERRADPQGYLEYASRCLADDLVELRDAELELAQLSQRGARALTEARELVAVAEELSGPFRLAYRRARDGGYPVHSAGREFRDRDELVEQVRLTLGERDGYAQRALTWTDLLSTLTDARKPVSEKAHTVALTLERASASTGAASASIALVEDVEAVLFDTAESLRALSALALEARLLLEAPSPEPAPLAATLAFLEGP